MATETKPKQFVRPMPATWWLKNPAYTWFMIRDVTSVFIAAYCVFLMVLMHRASGDPASFRAFYEKLASPLSTVLHLIVLVFACYHSITFFNLTPRVLVEVVCDHGLTAFVDVHMFDRLFARLVNLRDCFEGRARSSLRLQSHAHVGLRGSDIFAHVEGCSPGHLREYGV